MKYSRGFGSGFGQTPGRCVGCYAPGEAPWEQTRNVVPSGGKSVVVEALTQSWVGPAVAAGIVIVSIWLLRKERW